MLNQPSLTTQIIINGEPHELKIYGTVDKSSDFHYYTFALKDQNRIVISKLDGNQWKLTNSFSEHNDDIAAILGKIVESYDHVRNMEYVVKTLQPRLQLAKESTNLLREREILLEISDTLISEFPGGLRAEPLYSFALDVINELMGLQIGLGSSKAYELTDLYREPLLCQRQLIKMVVPADDKMQKMMTRFMSGG
ncbi:hypothetical protein ACLI1A_18085 [Flavobacterium sp. RHBU_3]|uniref:hypothetical protein n=1 Tax=Flavobacterium sp. RHBU_3 TaxID=3391184 RepID=UPI003984FE5E